MHSWPYDQSRENNHVPTAPRHRQTGTLIQTLPTESREYPSDQVLQEFAQDIVVDTTGTFLRVPCNRTRAHMLLSGEARPPDMKHIGEYLYLVELYEQHQA